MAVAVRRFAWRHPEWWVGVVAAVAWALLVLADVAGPAAGSHGAHHAPATAAPPRVDAAGAGLMAVAMMTPLVMPLARHVALTSLWSRRHRAQALFLAGYLAVWTAVAMALAGVAAVVVAVGGAPVALAGAGLAAAAWQLTPVKRRLLRRCGRVLPLAPRGARADLDCFRFGAIAAGSCTATCWGIMALASAAGHAVLVMAALAALQLRERVTRNAAPRATAAVLVVLAGALIGGSIVGVG